MTEFEVNIGFTQLQFIFIHILTQFIEDLLCVTETGVGRASANFTWQSPRAPGEDAQISN